MWLVVVVVVFVDLGIVFICVFVFCLLSDYFINCILVGVQCVWFIFGLGVIVWLIVAIAFVIAYLVVVINLLDRIFIIF